MQDAPLARLMPAWLAGRMGHPTGVRLFEQRYTRWLDRPEAVVCAPVSDVRHWAVLEEQRRVAEQQAEEERAAHHGNLMAMRDRQERLLQVVVPEVAARAEGGQRVWLGVPATPWDGHIPVAPALPPPPPRVQSTLTNAQRRDSQIRLLQLVVPRIAEEAGGADRVYLGRPQTPWNGRLPISRSQACGDKRHGGTSILWVWTGAGPSTLSLHTVVSPNSAVLGPKVGASWRGRGVRVVVEDANEAAAIVHKLGTSLVEITVISPQS